MRHFRSKREKNDFLRIHRFVFIDTKEIHYVSKNNQGVQKIHFPLPLVNANALSPPSDALSPPYPPSSDQELSSDENDIYFSSPETNELPNTAINSPVIPRPNERPQFPLPIVNTNALQPPSDCNNPPFSPSSDQEHSSDESDFNILSPETNEDFVDLIDPNFEIIKDLLEDPSSIIF
ncbi:hypothetical protein M9Y10_005581 [Tritrichomonas musculus]|uniref:Uncharacterized protein n=1 Tax=Tritrichomonas musculus TaxID=1915356 RepID=A0ABR2JC74_9EUKA